MKRNKKGMSPRRIKICINAAVYIGMALTVLMSCNGSGGGSDLLAGGGIGGTGISIGTISGFGSVIVNDVDFNTEKAEILVNGNSIGFGDSNVRRALALGMVVRVDGRYLADGSGNADRIVFSTNVKGPVQSITPVDSVVKILSLMGQSVIVDDQTRFKNTTFDRIAENNVLAVSGWPNDRGEIRATYVDKISDTPEPDTEVMIKGIVSEADIAQRLFRINQLVVDISEISVPLPAAGQLVFVQGVLDDNSILVAAALSIENELGLDDADNVDIESIVRQVSGPANFILGTTVVQIDEATSFKGLAPDDIVPGTRLLVKGSLTNRSLLADEIIAKDKVNIEGQVEEIIGNEINLKGLEGLVIHVSELTKIFGDVDDISGIESGHNVKILGYAGSRNNVEATQVKVEQKNRDKLKLQGPVADINGFTVTIFMVSVDTRSIPYDGFTTNSEGAVSRNKFFDLMNVGDTVSFNGNLVGDTAGWKAVELKEE